MKRILCLFMGLIGGLVLSAAVKVDPAKAVILLPQEKNNIQQYAALELQKHLRLISGKVIPIRSGGGIRRGEYAFMVGIPFPQDREKLRPEEGRFVVTPHIAYIYGDDSYYKKYPDFAIDGILGWRARTGTLFAVYEFLEKQFNVRWLEPGDRGIVCQKENVLNLTVNQGQWHPGVLVTREMRCWHNQRWDYYQNRFARRIPPEFRLTKTEYLAVRRDEQLWAKRQRMGRHVCIGYGHAFTNWRERFLKTHPEYLAQDEKGQVITPIINYPRHFQLCVSNPQVHRQIVEDYRKSRGETANICMNDGSLYCRCARCRSWDAPMVKNDSSPLTDRYVKFSNIMQNMLSEVNPKVRAVAYAYGETRLPPKREKVDSRIIWGFVPNLGEDVAKIYRAWHQAGARNFFLRPNHMHHNVGFPMGFEKLFFEDFQTGYRNGIIGTDYDTMYGFWPATGIADYILARAHVHPEKSFAELENEYASCFGAAAPEVKAYYRYWRTEIWDKRLAPNKQKILERGRYGQYQRGLVWDLAKYYQLRDFDFTDALLRQAANKKLTPSERQRVQNLQLANRHYRLTLETVAAPNPTVKLQKARELYKFRVDHRRELNFNWSLLLYMEWDYGDLQGTSLAVNFKDYAYVRPLPMHWHFKIDPQNRGLKERWFALDFNQIKHQWEMLSLYATWEKQSLKQVSPELFKQLQNYDGIGFYAQAFWIKPEWKNRRFFVHFGAVDESAWVYSNGKLCGQHICRPGSSDWKTPFVIEITPAIDWSRQWQNIFVRVEDKSGAGGIWKPVYLLMK